jgi:hypothetical protein
MTRKHFIQLAKICLLNTDPRGNEDCYDAYQRRISLANDLADFCEAQNYRFDRSRFLAACGVE